MSRYSNYNIVYRLQKWMDSVPGQTFLNYAYSWGASVVILGTLFKLTHLPGANLMLYIGMGTEVVVFFLSAFDRPFDKTADGMDLPTHITDDEEEEAQDEASQEQAASQQGALQGVVVIGGPGGGNGGSSPASGNASVSAQDVNMAIDTGRLQEQQEKHQAMQDAQEQYVEELRKLTEMLQKVNEQSMRLTRDSEEMENLNRTLTGITRVYEMQLKSASQQMGTIDNINDESKKMAGQIEQLNAIYARMIEAMTVNMNKGNA